VKAFTDPRAELGVLERELGRAVSAANTMTYWHVEDRAKDCGQPAAVR